MRKHPWTTAVGAAVLGLCSLTALAQSGQPEGAPQGNWRRGGGPERQLDRLTHLLTLTPDQQTGVKALLEQQSTQMKALRAKNEGEAAAVDTPDAQRAEMIQIDQIRDETNSKIAALLDENQKKTFNDWVAKQKAERARRQAPAPEPPGAA